MTLAYIRGYYQVPATRGRNVIVDGALGVIVGARGPHLRVRFGDGRTVSAHPTWRVHYLEDVAAADPGRIGPGAQARTCPVCLLPAAANADGTIADHRRPDGPVCSGSGALTYVQARRRHEHTEEIR